MALQPVVVVVVQRGTVTSTTWSSDGVIYYKLVFNWFKQIVMFRGTMFIVSYDYVMYIDTYVYSTYMS